MRTIQTADHVMRPTSYALFQDGNRVILRGYSPTAVDGFWNVEIMNRFNGGALPGLRRHAEHLASAWGVPLDDRLRP